MSKIKPSRFLSQLVRNQIQDSDACILVWENDLKITIDENQWNNILTDIYLLTNIDYLRWFQYRIVHKILITNVHRNKYDANISDRCQFCHALPETVLHILIQCPIVKRFWTAFQRWLKYIFDIVFEIDEYNIVFNAYSGIGKLIVNTMILVAKQYIYSAKCKNEIPKFIQFVPKISQIHAIEKTIALRQNKFQKYNEKWRIFLRL